MKIASFFTNIIGENYHRVRVKDEDDVPESASLMHAKLADPLRYGEKLAEKLRKSKRKQL